jgi:hypothetical protein
VPHNLHLRGSRTMAASRGKIKPSIQSPATCTCFFYTDKFVQVNGVPEEPGEIAADLNTRDLDNRIVHTERDKHTFRGVFIGLERLAAPQVSDIERGDAPLLDGHRGDSRRLLRIHGCRRITDDEYFRVTFQLKIRVHHGAANAIVRPRKRFNQLGCANSRRPDNCVRRDGLVPIDLDRIFEHARDSRGSSHFNSAHIQPLARVRRQFRTNPTQDIRRCLQHDQPNLGCVDPAILSRDIAEEEVTHFRDKFDAGVAASNHNKREHGAAHGGIRGVIGVLAQIDDPFAQFHRLLK